MSKNLSEIVTTPFFTCCILLHSWIHTPMAASSIMSLLIRWLNWNSAGDGYNCIHTCVRILTFCVTAIIYYMIINSAYALIKSTNMIHHNCVLYAKVLSTILIKYANYIYHLRPPMGVTINLLQTNKIILVFLLKYFLGTWYKFNFGRSFSIQVSGNHHEYQLRRVSLGSFVCQTTYRWSDFTLFINKKVKNCWTWIKLANF